MVDTLGEEWMATWWRGLPGVADTPTGETRCPPSYSLRSLRKCITLNALLDGGATTVNTVMLIQDGVVRGSFNDVQIGSVPRARCQDREVRREAGQRQLVAA